MCIYGVMALCDDCKMLVIVSRKMGIIDYKGCALVVFSVNVVFMMGLYGIMVTVVQ
jgi:hypothetical protein